MPKKIPSGGWLNSESSIPDQDPKHKDALRESIPTPVQDDVQVPDVPDVPVEDPGSGDGDSD